MFISLDRKIEKLEKKLNKLKAIKDIDYSKSPIDDFEINSKHYFELYKEFIEKHTDVIDWYKNTPKYFLSYNYDFLEDIVVDSCYNSKDQGIIYASSPTIIREAVEYIGGSEIAKKYILKI